ncbi:MAG: hypothetical protein ACKVWR_09850 [Acidimicrobiales bacterium]
MTTEAAWMVIVARAWRHDGELIVRLVRAAGGGPGARPDDDPDDAGQVVRGAGAAAAVVEDWLATWGSDAAETPSETS